MPFSALRLKKVRRYDVARKALFLLPVQLLDNTFMECTMNENSTGLELLQHIAQRLSIREWQYFGLKFINKHMQYQWLSLDLPLKQQLSKCAHELFVKFSVRFYIRNINQLKDEFTRYQFFLQLRNEIIEGALLCSAEQSVILAAYSIQAAYGDFDPDRHSPRHLKDFFLLPKRMSVQEEVFCDLLIQVSDTHGSFRGMSPVAAETYYIVEAQNLEELIDKHDIKGYGEEYYAAKDASGNDLLLGTSHAGITIKHPTGRPLLSISWNNLKSVTVAKRRSICLECVGTGRSSQRVVQIFLENAEFSAYVLSNITLQQEFYTTDGISVAAGSLPEFDAHQQLTAAHVKPFSLMFRPNLSNILSVPSTPPPVDVDVGKNFTRPDVVQFTKSYGLRSSTDVLFSDGSPTLEQGIKRLPGDLLYREAPAYDFVQGLASASKEMDGQVNLLRPDTRNVCNASAGPADFLKNYSSPISAFFSADMRTVQTNSTPELRFTSFSESINAHKEFVSCSTPDLLCMTVPSLSGRPLSSRQLHVVPDDSHLIRLAALDDLSTTSLAEGHAIKSRTFSVVSEENSTPMYRSLLTTKSNSSPDQNINDSINSSPVKEDTSPRPAGSNVPIISTKDSRRLDLEQRISSGNLLIEFEQIPKKRQLKDSCSVAMLAENRQRNRYPDLLPYDDTRIHLLDPTRKNPKGYINASEIILKCEDLERRYIASQDPIGAVTSEDFLSMLSMTAQGETSLVVVLSDEPSVPWAKFMEGEKEVSLEGFHLRRESVSKASGFLTVCFWLYDRRSKQSRRKVWAIHFYSWNEQGVPDRVDNFCQMMQELESLRLQFHNAVASSSPMIKDSVIVVCRTGSGRSGMMILFDFMRLCLDHNQNVDLARVLTHMRIQRMHMVQTVSQYRFVYTALVEHLASSRLI